MKTAIVHAILVKPGTKLVIKNTIYPELTEEVYEKDAIEIVKFFYYNIPSGTFTILQKLFSKTEDEIEELIEWRTKWKINLVIQMKEKNI